MFVTVHPNTQSVKGAVMAQARTSTKKPIDTLISRHELKRIVADMVD